MHHTLISVLTIWLHCISNSSDLEGRIVLQSLIIDYFFANVCGGVFSTIIRLLYAYDRSCEEGSQAWMKIRRAMFCCTWALNASILAGWALQIEFLRINGPEIHVYLGKGAGPMLSIRIFYFWVQSRWPRYYLIKMREREDRCIPQLSSKRVDIGYLCTVLLYVVLGGKLIERIALAMKYSLAHS